MNTRDAGFIITNLLDSWSELSQRLMKDPEKLVNNQLNFWRDYQNLFTPASNEQSTHDKRFKHPDWQNHIALQFIKNSYFLLSKYIENLINDVVGDENEKLRKKIQFFARQYLDAISPSNFANINPEVLAKMTETNGESVIAGFRQFLEDIDQGSGQLNIKMSNLDEFKLGENIACTPGKVVYQNDIIQLLQYTPTTKQVYQIPLLIIPPWINKFYILDLQEENSLVKWLVDQGFTVFMISWVNATEQHREKKFSDYLFEGPMAALKTIKKITGEEQANVVGYCIGGTLLGCMLAYLEKKQDTRVRSATFLTTLLDFSEPGDLGVFIDKKQIKTLENQMQQNGFLDGRIMAAVFSALRANDLIWTSFVNNYLKGQKPRPFDLLYWNSDATNIPAKVHSFYLRNMYLKNLLVEKNKIKLRGVSLDLSEVTLPCYFLAAHDDHIVPWQTSFKGSQFLGTKPKFVLASSGHVAGVVNPPQRKKYGYWVNANENLTAENFLTNAKFVEGSWWNDWVGWLKQYSGELREVKAIKNQKSLGDAPGSYVQVSLYNSHPDPR